MQDTVTDMTENAELENDGRNIGGLGKTTAPRTPAAIPRC